MRDHVNEALEELKKFLRDYTLQEISNDSALQSELRKIFKRYYPFIVWSETANSVKLWDNVEKQGKFITYLNEAASDVCFSIFVSFQGMYKPSLIMLRSALENFFRSILIAHGVAPNTTSVYELIELTKGTKLKSDHNGSFHLNRLYSQYATLCTYAHSADQLHMSLTKVVGVFPRHNREEFALSSTHLMRFCVDVCSLLCIMLPHVFQGMHHSFRDLILDVVPRSVRRSLSEAI